MIKVSVIIPAYRSRSFIERCLRSLEAQTLKPTDFEVIVVLDGPDDLVSNIISDKFPSVIILTHEKNFGLPTALNTGLRKSKGQYAVRVDSDDYVEIHYLEYLLYAIEVNPKYAAVACDYIEVDIKENHVRHCNSSIEPIGCGVIFSLQALINVGLYDKAFLAREEEELMTRFINAGYNKLHLPLPLYRYRKHSNSITSDTVLMDYYEDLLLK
ncbi:glycosyltransferase family 2 protein [Amylibacter sp.]|nr:glycosyltransferase family 2 protein [Amylibacter sp.]